MGDRDPPGLSVLGSSLAALVLLALVETGRVPLAHLRAVPYLSALSVAYALAFFAPILLIMGIAHRVPSSRKRLAAGFEGLSLGILLHASLFAEHKFFVHLPLIGTSVALAVFFGLMSHWLRDDAQRPTAPAKKNALRVLLLVAAVLVHLTNCYTRRGLAPSLHLYLHLASFTLLSLGLRNLRPPWFSRARARRSAQLVGVLGILSVLVSLSSASDSARPLHASHTTLGQAQFLFLPHADPESEAPVSAQPLEDEDAWRVFHSHSGLPLLAPEWKLEAKNILLVMVEATRQDQTTLDPTQSGLTPRLQEFANHPASFWFSRASTPASATFQASAAILSMRYPSAIPLTIGHKDWLGHLDEKLVLVPSAFKKAGYQTWWVGHDHKTVFSKLILGFKQHFESVRLFTFGDNQINGDEKIVSAARKKLAASAKDGRPFFGWVFLASPHSRYRPHYKSMPSETPMDFYRQELRFADEQIGRLLDQLDKLELSEDTIVIITGDHGEEFEEHGWTGHATGVYTEVRDVPLIVHVPGASGGRFDAPTSSLYVLPWLLRRAEGPPLQLATQNVRDFIAPTMRATQGAAVTELLGRRNMKTALRTPQHSIIYDFVTSKVEVYDLEADPHEHEDLAPRDDEATQAMRARLDAYRAQRRAHRSFIVPPT